MTELEKLLQIEKTIQVHANAIGNLSLILNNAQNDITQHAKIINEHMQRLKQVQDFVTSLSDKLDMLSSHLVNKNTLPNGEMHNEPQS